MADFRVIFVLPFVLVATHVHSIAGADPSPLDQRLQWRQSIVALGSDRFSDRDAATRRLIEAGVDVIPVVAAAVSHEDPEVRNRAAFVLQQMARSKDAAANLSARQSLRNLAKSDDTRASRAAKRVLMLLLEQAAQRLRLLGATIRWDREGHVRAVDFSKCKIDNDDLRLLAEVKPLELDLRFTTITDEAMVHIREQSQLERLNLQATRVTDAGLRELVGLKKIRSLSVERTRVTDAGMEHLKTLQRLETLYLGGSQVLGPGLASLRGLPINYLSFQRSEVGDSVTKYLVGWRHLRTLGLDETGVTNNCLAPLADLESLEVLWLDKTNVTDGCAKDLVRLKSLTTLHLKDTKISRGGLTRIEEALEGVRVITPTRRIRR